MKDQPKRRGRPPKDKPLSGAERAKSHRMRKKKTALDALEGNPAMTIARLQAALEASGARIRELQDANAELNRRLADANAEIIKMSRELEARERFE